ncbi:MAG: tripartite tricarboxylate transporter TctB family protein [Planctomycetota bacterium]|nr:tripartite tricarboxylate transporter TctB family protein [Planctomycetota bacterium]
MPGFELAAALAAVAISAAICILSLGIPLGLAPHFWAGPGAFPFLVGFIVLLLSVFWTVDALGKKARAKAAAEAPAATTPSWAEEVFGPPDRRKRLFLVAALTLIFVFALIPAAGRISNDFGFVAATFIFIFAGLRIFSGYSSRNVLVISALTAVCVYYTFEHGLLLPMPR